MTLKEFIYQIPKAELHLHIEGSFEPELMFEIAKRNKIEIKFNSVEEVKAAYEFNNLQEFLDIYYEGAGVLIHEKDFYEMTWAYLEKIHQENVLHTEIFFDPQTHTDRGIDFDVVFNGIYKAMEDGKEKLGISYKIIMCFLRHLDQVSAFETLDSALKHKDKIIGVGLDSGELGNPPSKFQNVFKKAAQKGFELVAHAGEEGPAEYVWEALDLLNVSRIDHGNRSMDDEKLVARLAKEQMPLTLCPLSNLKLCVIDDLKDYPLKEMIAKGLMCTLNSDDPAYFGGYLSQNYEDVANAIDLSKEDIYELAKNSFKASYLTEAEKQVYLNKVESFYQENK
ncbi:MAG: adenosine deaminase [Chitinophagales bacterium]